MLTLYFAVAVLLLDNGHRFLYVLVCTAALVKLVHYINEQIKKG